MHKKTAHQISHRTLDYLSRKHPWFDALMRNRWIAITALTVYAAIVALMIGHVYNGEEGGWKEIIKSYSPLFVDILIISVLSLVILIIRGYFIEENSRVNSELLPIADFFIPIDSKSIKITIDDSFFKRHDAVSAILDALPIDQSDFFLAHAGSLDIPKLTVKSIKIKEPDELELNLGIGSFKEFFFTHHFPDYPLSRSSSRDSGRRETLRELFSPIYIRSYSKFFKNESKDLQLLNYTPNTMGITGCIQIINNKNSVIVIQRRGHHESAARGVLHLSYAGTISAYPDFSEGSPSLSLDGLANDEFEDEFMESEAGEIIKTGRYTAHHKIAGFCTNSQYLFQPEIFILTTITMHDANVMQKLLIELQPNRRKKFIAFNSFDDLEKFQIKSHFKIRPLCQVAIEKIYKPILINNMQSN